MALYAKTYPYMFLTVRQRNTETPSDGVILPITLRQTVSRQGLYLPGQTMPAGTRYMEDGRLIGRGSLIKTYTSEVLPHDVYIVRVGDVVRKIKL